jgi:hypothetical protein
MYHKIVRNCVCIYNKIICARNIVRERWTQTKDSYIINVWHLQNAKLTILKYYFNYRLIPVSGKTFDLNTLCNLYVLVGFARPCTYAPTHTYMDTHARARTLQELLVLRIWIKVHCVVCILNTQASIYQCRYICIYVCPPPPRHLSFMYV